MPPIVSIIILNWNGLALTIECLESVKKVTYANYKVVVVDNGSKGDDVESLKSRYGNYIHLIENDRNYGFAKGNNIGIKYALENFNPQYILLLNNDTIVDSEFLTPLVRIAESDEAIGSCQSKIMSLKDPELIDAVGIGFFKKSPFSITANYPPIALSPLPCQIGYQERDEGQYSNECEVFGACACSALYRREMLDEIGLLDEDFFAYYEDVDFSWRARLYGWKSLYVPTSLVYHHSSATGKSIKLYFLARNQTFYVLKNAPLDIVLTHMCELILSIPMTIRGGLKYRDYRNMFILLKGKFDAIAHIPKMLKKRRKLHSSRLVPNSEIIRWFK